MRKANEATQKWICPDCVGEPFLSGLVAQSGFSGTCSYCDEVDVACWSIDELADRVDVAFEQHFVRTAQEPDIYQEMAAKDPDGSYDWFRDGETAIDLVEEVASIPSEAAVDVVAILDDRYSNSDPDQQGLETEFSDDARYEERTAYGVSYIEKWRTVEQSLRNQARFFNREAAEALTAIFKHVDQLKTSGGRRVVVRIGPEAPIKHLYRARAFQSQATLFTALERPSRHLGPPPAQLASAGRMNAAGIAAFYGATDSATAIAEVRPPVGSSVAVARFDLVRSLRVLDLTRLETAKAYGSVFDPDLEDRLDQVDFLQALNRLMSRPVLPSDEALEYVTTQAVADYLATAHEPPLDGIVYRSAQVRRGKNVVLFNRASRVLDSDAAEDDRVEVGVAYEAIDEGKVTYDVLEHMPATPPASPKRIADERGEWLGQAGSTLWDAMQQEPAADLDPREVSLSLDGKPLAVHDVVWTRFGTTTAAVMRRKMAHDRGEEAF